MFSQPATTLGWIFCKKGLFPQAIDALEAAVERDPRNAGYLYHLGSAYAGAGDDAKARAALDKALALGLSTAEAERARQLSARLKS